MQRHAHHATLSEPVMSRRAVVKAGLVGGAVLAGSSLVSPCQTQAADQPKGGGIARLRGDAHCST